MFGSYEQDEANIATTAGFPGVYPCAAVATRSSTSREATAERNLAKSGLEQVNDVSSQFANGIGNGGVCAAKEDVFNKSGTCGHECGNGHVSGRGTNTAVALDVEGRFEEVEKAGTVYAGYDPRNAGGCDTGFKGESGEPFDPSNLPDEDYLDLLFVPLSQKDRHRLSTGQTMESLFQELLPGIPASAPGGREPGDCGQKEGVNNSVPMVTSDDEYMDQMFAPLTREDKARLSSNQTKESLFKELLGDALVFDGPRVCEERPDEGDTSKHPTGNADAIERPGSMTDHKMAVGPRDVRMHSHVPTSMGGASLPSQPQIGASQDEGAMQESALAPKAPHPQNPDETSKPVTRSKRKRSSRKKGADAAQEGEQPRQKRRRTRVEDMNPADVHVCHYEGCGKRFARRYNLTVHQRAHRNEYPFRCDVPNCGKPFMWHSSLTRHLRVHDKRRKSGGRKQRGRSAARAQQLGQAPYPAGDGSPAGSRPRGLNVQALVGTVSFDQTLIALVGKKGAKIKTEVNVKAHMEDRWRQFAFRHQQIVGMWNSPIVMSREVFSRMCTEILIPDSMETDA